MIQQRVFKIRSWIAAVSRGGTSRRKVAGAEPDRRFHGFGFSYVSAGGARRHTLALRGTASVTLDPFPHRDTVVSTVTAAGTAFATAAPEHAVRPAPVTPGG